ncbi:hypothetical protein [Streptomyces sp. Tu 3180]|uniref:hypothetical protein n=1 Tax=Streptomyces sp. Tu 3180 TaxID=2682611 RepID=UPI00135C1529|nr:hypothetical protein [Streptomyces sp. Tu 3180]KAF3469527.1 hypothetical protein GL259_08095 [Streptomyces sp. Tu 3180]
MGTAERREAPEDGAAAQVTIRSDAGIPQRGTSSAGHGATGGRDVPASGHDGEGRADRADDGTYGTAGDAVASGAHEQVYHRPLWVEEPARRPRLPDPVRTAAVRAVLVIAVTLIQAMVAFLCTLAGSWLAFPMVVSGIVSTILATWAALDVWVTRQVWKQRHGVVSTPSSTARALRRERRRARRQERSAERTRARIRRRGGAGQLSHS